MIILNRILLYITPFNAFRIALCTYLAKLKDVDTKVKIGYALPFLMMSRYLFSVLDGQNSKIEYFTNLLYGCIKGIPMGKLLVDKEINKIALELQDDEFKNKAGQLRLCNIPNDGYDEDVIISELGKNCIEDKRKISGGIYVHNTDQDFKVKVYEQTKISNPMHGDLWPHLQDKETLTIEMCLNLYNASDSGWGLITGGGSLSILMACMAHRNKFRTGLLPTMHPEIIMSDRTHPAFKKACEILGIKRIVIPVDPITFKVNINKMRRSMTPNTIMLVANCPAFPEGIMDNVESISKLAKFYGIGCHVDACLGGFIIPFAEDIGLTLPPFDFRLNGVTSISADLHKYGMSEKGYSAILFKDFHNYGKYATFKDLSSLMGMYLSQGLEGSRPARVDAWATMMKFGRVTYVDNLKKMIEIKNEIVDHVDTTIPSIKISGTPLLTVFAIRSSDPKVNAMLVASHMKNKGWIINGLPEPEGFHFCITPMQINYDNIVTDFTNDLMWSVKRAFTNPDEKPTGQLGMYDTIRDKVPTQLIKGPLLNEIGDTYLHIITSARKQY